MKRATSGSTTFTDRRVRPIERSDGLAAISPPKPCSNVCRDDYSTEGRSFESRANPNSTLPNPRRPWPTQQLFPVFRYIILFRVPHSQRNTRPCTSASAGNPQGISVDRHPEGRTRRSPFHRNCLRGCPSRRQKRGRQRSWRRGSKSTPRQHLSSLFSCY
jgi:hypothetical protein